MEAQNHLIDMTIIRAGGQYVRFVKDETVKNIRVDTLPELTAEPVPVHSEVLDAMLGVEGPECYQLPDGQWCLIVDRFAKGLGYLPLLSGDPASGDFREVSAGQFDLGANKKRHGGVMAIRDEEYARLIAAYGC